MNEFFFFFFTCEYHVIAHLNMWTHILTRERETSHVNKLFSTSGILIFTRGLHASACDCLLGTEHFT